MTLVQFRARFPEFSLAENAYVQSFLTAAIARLDATAWPADMLVEGIGYLAAHLMALTPAGHTAGMSSQGMSTYGREYDNLCRIVAGGPQVI
jgi:hypothetical protein